MTRVLPWKRTGALARSSTTPIKKDPDRDAKASSATSAASSKTRSRQSRARRSGSTSPPPEPLQESFMVEGLDNDDRYHMVEDELLATARQFTAHLHAAEYLRLKDAAKSQNAAVISQIARPVVGGMSRIAEKKKERADLLRKQNAAIRNANKDDSDSDDDEVGPDSALKGTSLYTLMASPRKQVPRLDKIASFSKATRAAAGFGAGSSEMADSSRLLSLFSSSPTRHLTPAMHVDDDDSDDLDVLRRPSTSRIDNIRSTLGSSRYSNRQQPNLPVPTTGMKRPSAFTRTPSPPAQGSQTTQTITQNTIALSDEDSDGDLFGVKSRIAQRSTRERKRAKTTQQESSKTSTTTTSSSTRDFIPGFL
ncbi:hypothetical protein PG993_003892 [Apiospora rasikravindrae]|uniref:Uncharacterized protein n=1 Tax=Apiospora rasikravindrae TaxID=990691 RepID=A0ABR1U1C2_9PEZI